MESRIAIVDLGTNTFHLLIVDVKDNQHHVVYRERKAVKLGKKGINKGLITEKAINRALLAVTRFRTAIDNFNATKVFAYGTSALRNASNQEEVINRIKENTGIKVKVISGDEEARLIYMGVRSAISLGNEKSLIIDIGGGSVEFIIGDENEIYWKESFEIGAQRLLEEYHTHDPIRAEDLKALDEHFDNKLESLFKALNQYKPKTLVGSSGTFDTLSDIYCASQGIEKLTKTAETPLSFQGFHDTYKELIVRDKEARMEIPGMIELRVDMIVVACSLIHYILRRYSFTDLRVSSYALKEGVLADIMKVNHTV
ncbi:MAG: Ppx/GppA phosphatase family protein [Cyclobacteriaceae bacterium]